MWMPGARCRVSRILPTRRRINIDLRARCLETLFTLFFSQPSPGFPVASSQLFLFSIDTSHSNPAPKTQSHARTALTQQQETSIICTATQRTSAYRTALYKEETRENPHLSRGNYPVEGREKPPVRARRSLGSDVTDGMGRNLRGLVHTSRYSDLMGFKRRNKRVMLGDMIRCVGR